MTTQSDSSVSPLSGTPGDEPTKETREWLRQSLNVVWLSEAEKQIADYITGLRREVAELRAASAPSAPSSADPSNLREIRGLVGVAAPSSAGTPEASERDWPEDFAHENGQYINACLDCGRQFRGHKRRVICKLCSRSPARAPAPDEEQRIREIEARWSSLGDSQAKPQSVLDVEFLLTALRAARSSTPPARGRNMPYSCVEFRWWPTEDGDGSHWAEMELSEDLNGVARGASVEDAQATCLAYIVKLLRARSSASPVEGTTPTFREGDAETLRRAAHAIYWKQVWPEDAARRDADAERLRELAALASAARSSPSQASEAPNDDTAPVQEKRGRKSNSPCEKCGKMEVYVSQDSDHDADFTIHCYGCGMHYRVDGPDA